MSRVSQRRPAARGLAAFCLLGLASPSRAQAAPSDLPAATDPATLDPGSPMAPLPDLGIAWPDPSSPDPSGAANVPAAPPRAETEGEQRYAVKLAGLEGLDAAAIRLRFDAVSSLAQGEGKAANVAQIDRRARDDAESLRSLLIGEGHYDATVDTRVAAAEAGGRLTVTLTAAPGALYRFSSVAVTGLEAAPKALRDSFAVKADDPVAAAPVQAAQAALTAALGRAGYSFAQVADPDIVVDHAAHMATLTLAVTPGGAQRFGRFVVQGRPLFSVAHLATISRLKPGRPLDAGRIDDLRRALIATGLVSTVQLTPVATADPHVADLAVRLERAPPRTVAGQIGYGTGEGASVELSWTHRNLIKPEGAVTFRGVAGTQEQLLGASLRRGNFRARDQVLTAQVVASHTRRDAYDARSFTLAAGIERQTNIIWQKTWTWSYGGELVASDERDVLLSTGLPRRRTFLIAAVPTSLAYDGSDDLLNPTRGYRLSGRVSPELSLQGGAFGYGRFQIDGSAYLPTAGRVVMAGRIRIGSILGAGRDDIAPSRRFYVGGGGSVRGYGYQDVGPRDGNNDPIGGRSMAEFSLEARVRFGDFGIVPFLDGGNLYTAPYPRLTGFRYGAGIGARYYTGFGPIRVDVGTPLTPKKGDARVAVYVSLGQAF